MLEEYLNVDTPENVKFDFEVAGIGSRFIAGLIDTVAILVIQLLIALLFGLIIYLADFPERLTPILIAIGILLFFIVLWGYYILFEIAWNGQTPGKRQINLRTIRTDGMPAGPYEIVIRNLMRLVDILPGSYGVAIIAMFVNPQARRLGDLAAGTLVVFDQTALSLSDIQDNRRTDVVIPEMVRALPVQLIKNETAAMGESLLARFDNLSNGRQLAVQILHQMYTEMGLDAEQHVRRDPPQIEIQQICAYIQEKAAE